jgi:hypothetical protein
MGKKKLPYREGDWFTVPLRKGGLATGLVARSAPKGRVLFGYFFGPKTQSPPGLKELEQRQPSDAVLVARFGDLGLVNGEWKAIGQSPSWSKTSWPMPVFRRTDVVSGQSQAVSYADDDPSREVGATSHAPSEMETAPEDGLMGYGAVEIVLTKRLDQ